MTRIKAGTTEAPLSIRYSRSRSTPKKITGRLPCQLLTCKRHVETLHHRDQSGWCEAEGWMNLWMGSPRPSTPPWPKGLLSIWEQTKKCTYCLLVVMKSAGWGTMDYSWLFDIWFGFWSCFARLGPLRQTLNSWSWVSLDSCRLSVGTINNCRISSNKTNTNHWNSS